MKLQTRIYTVGYQASGQPVDGSKPPHYYTGEIEIIAIDVVDCWQQCKSMGFEPRYILVNGIKL